MGVLEVAITVRCGGVLLASMVEAPTNTFWGDADAEILPRHQTLNPKSQFPRP